MRNWVFTTKPGHFDMAKALVPGETLDWPSFSRFKFEIGDLVFFYASSPILQLIGKLEIEDNNLPFCEANPRNDLRKWPKHHSYIPWLRMRVLQSAPIPFKPLQRGSLYYHTEFKPSPYPKLLHEGEIEYVLKAFDEAMTYSAEVYKYEGGLNPAALARISRADIFKEIARNIEGAIVVKINFSKSDKSALDLRIQLPNDSNDYLTLQFGDVKRTNWSFDHLSDTVTGIRLTLLDTYLLCTIDGAQIEILADKLTID